MADLAGTPTPAGDVEAPALSLPKGGGALRGIGEHFDVNPANGTASFRVPIATPEGRSSLGPALELSYDSGNGNGPFGFGWRLTQPAVSRRVDRAVPTYEDGRELDVFVLSGSDDLVRTGAPEERAGHSVERFRPSVERDFDRIERWTRLSDGDAHWRSFSHDNVLTVYGWDADSRIADPSDPRRVLSWLATRCHDDRGNAVVYEYVGENPVGVDLSAAAERGRSRAANRYLKRIRYGNRTPLQLDPTKPSFRPSHLPPPNLAADDWMFEVVLDYGAGHYVPAPANADGDVIVQASPAAAAGSAWPARDDPFSTYRAGFELRTHRLCRRILTFHRFPSELGSAASLVRAVELSYRSTPSASFVSSITESGFRARDGGGYLRRSLPTLELTYARSALEDPDADGGEVATIDSPSLGNASALWNETHRWIDLDGEGLPGLVAQEGGGWFYRRSNGDGTLAATELLETRPSRGEAERQQPLDLDGDGTVDIAWFGEPASGFHSRTSARSFDPFRPFDACPNLDWRETRLADMVGDGRADMLVLDGAALRWHRSLGREGFAAAATADVPHREDDGPRVTFVDSTRTILLADMTGDGLADIVRVRDGDVCYWPSLGYGRFGAKVAMDDAPLMETPELFDGARVRLVDTDGSGTADLVYLGTDGVRVYLNRSGNGWSPARRLRRAPPAIGGTSIAVVDLLGRGTACLVWTSDRPSGTGPPASYLDLAGETKPHLLVAIKNNLGAEMRIDYAPSTKFYLVDRVAGTPWTTRLAFPIQVVERVDEIDTVARNRFVRRFAYHHGYFDTDTREFRGFGRVDRFDTEELAVLTASDDLPEAQNIDAASYVPPTMTRSWFHLGADLDHGAEAATERLTRVALPDGLEPSAMASARRALIGATLRSEVYGLDGSDAAAHPFKVHEHGYTVAELEPGVFHARESETIEVDLDRSAVDDPRIAHRLTITADGFGNPLLSATVAYGRRPGAVPDPLLTAADVEVMRRTRITFAVATYTNAVDPLDAWRTPMLAERTTYELFAPGSAGPAYRADELAALVTGASDGAHDLPYDDAAGAGAVAGQPFRRLIGGERTYFRANDLAGPLGLGSLESLGLRHVVHRLAQTAELATTRYTAEGLLTAAQLNGALTAAGYVLSGADGGWWAPSPTIAYSADDGDTPSEELAVATAHFFRPRRHVDALGAMTRVTYDAHDLLPIERADAVGNREEVHNDYRVLAPVLLTDTNGNRSAVIHDALGHVAATAFMGKAGETVGDALDGVDPDPTQASIAAYLADPTTHGAALLGTATSCTVTSYATQPAVICTLARETHDAGGAVGATRIQHTLTYSDGFGREVQVKRHAGDGTWLTEGWTIFDNKGEVVRRYEPFFDDTPAFRFGAAVGVSAIAFRDAIGRTAVVFHPHHAWEKTVAAPWRAEAWDVNDTLLIDPTADPIAGPYASRMPPVMYEPTWHQQRSGGALGAAEQRAAASAEVHAGTPSVTFYDGQQRAFLTVTHNRLQRKPTDPVAEARYRTEQRLDVEGRLLEEVDAGGRVCARYRYDLLGNRLGAATMDGGQRWMLFDARGSEIQEWDARGHVFAVTYDPLRRITSRSVRGLDPARSDPRTIGGGVVYERLVYGESLPGGAAANLRAQVARVHDGAGVRTLLYDFKGNCVSIVRQMLVDADGLADWTGAPTLEAEPFIAATTFDALDRPLTATSPEGIVTTTGYDELGRIQTLATRVPGEASVREIVRLVTYNPHGDRLQVRFGNGMQTDYEYDPLTFRLIRQITTRPATPDPFASRVFSTATKLQDLQYVHDAAGNVVQITDNALRSPVAGGGVITPEIVNTYDADYRLVQTAGREQRNSGDVETLRRYVEEYEHDGDGNLLRVGHTASGGNWERTYEYAEPSAVEPAKVGNRLTRAALVGEAVAPFTYDGHGSMTRMPHLTVMRSDFKDQILATSRQVAQAPEVTAYAYDATGSRVRKVVRRQSGTRRSERLYLGTTEIYREYAPDGTTVTLRRDTEHIVDGHHRLVLLERAVGQATTVRYQLSNHLESACVEVDEGAAVLTIEEFTPFGMPALVGGRAVAEVGLKRYRFIGKERDAETDLHHHGARYYAPWLGRWTSCDPEWLAPTADRGSSSVMRPVNLYAYARNSPFVYTDPTGRADAAAIGLAISIPLLVTAAPLAALGFTAWYLDSRRVPVEGAPPEERDSARWAAGEEGGLIDWWVIGHYGLPAAISVVTGLIARALGMSAEGAFFVSAMAGTLEAYLWETVERKAMAAIHQNARRGGFFTFIKKGSESGALEWRTNTLWEDIMLGYTAAFSWAYLTQFLWHMASPGRGAPLPDTSFVIATTVVVGAIVYTAGRHLVYGGYIPTRDTHTYNPETDKFVPRS